WILAAVLAIAASPVMAEDAVPAELVGQWAVDGACGDVENSITVTADTLAFGSTDPAAVTFSPDDSPSGNGAIHWAEEGSVDNFEHAVDQDVLLYNGQGYGMGVA